jgi:hypothetical protein
VSSARSARASITWRPRSGSPTALTVLRRQLSRLERIDRLLDEVPPALTYDLERAPASDGPADFGARSCEQLAEEITRQIRARYGEDRQIECEVLEDGILGGGIRWPV